MTEEEIIAAARRELEAVGHAEALLYMAPSEQPPMDPKLWNDWRRMPQTRRLMSWVLEKVVSRRATRLGDNPSNEDIVKMFEDRGAVKMGERIVDAFLHAFGPSKPGEVPSLGASSP